MVGDQMHASNPSTANPYVKTATVLFTKIISEFLDTILVLPLFSRCSQLFFFPCSLPVMFVGGIISPHSPRLEVGVVMHSDVERALTGDGASVCDMRLAGGEVESVVMRLPAKGQF